MTRSVQIVHRSSLRVFSALLLLTGVDLLTAGCGGQRSGDRDAGAVTVVAQTELASYQQVPRRLEVTGTAEPWRRVSPGTKIMGRVAEVLVEEGEAVRTGQLLARVEGRDLKAAVAQARAAIAMAEAQEENAAAQFERMKDLFGRGSVTAKNLEDATAGFRVAQAGVEQARAALDTAQMALTYAEIRSPLGGWVVRKLVEAGDMAVPGQPLFTVEDLGRLKIEVQVPESEVVDLAEGDRATVGVDALDEEIEASVYRVVPSADRRSRTFSVQLAVDNPDGRIRSGMFVRAGLQRGSRRALLVPSAALVRRGQLEGLFVVSEEGVARLRWVRTGERLGERVEIFSGLSEGERYVAASTAELADGVAIGEVGP